MNESRARSRIWISALQTRLILLSIAYLMALALCLGGLIFWPLIERVQDESVGVAERAQAASELLSLHARFWPGFALIAAAFVAHQLYMSHRFAGPLYRIRVTLRGMADGVLPREIRLRKRDFLTEEADVVNELLTSSREHVERTRVWVERMELALESQAEMSDASRHELRVALSQLRDELSRFDLNPGAGPNHSSGVVDPPPALPGGARPGIDVAKVGRAPTGANRVRRE